MTQGSVQQVLGDSFFGQLKALVIATTGMAFYADKDVELARIVAGRMAETHRSSCARYLQLITEGDGGEMDALVAELTIGETYFFRHKEQFAALRDIVLPDLLERNAAFRSLRIWSAGCATGPEPYSLAIMLRREFGVRLADWQVRIIGTDINQRFLDHARAGRYDEWAFRATPEEIRRSCFETMGKQWRIRQEYREMVQFQYHNLIQSPFPSITDGMAGFDLIVCRNVVIYFDTNTIERLVPCFHQSLSDGGWLVMGHAEPNIELFRPFRALNTAGTVLYQRQDQPSSLPGSAPVVVMPMPRQPRADKRPAARRATTPATVRPPSPKAEARPVPVPLQPGADDLGGVRKLADQGRWDEALAACARWMERDALDARPHFYRGLVLNQQDDLDGGEGAFRRAIYLDRHYVLPHYHLGLLLLRRGELVGAQRSLRNVLMLLGTAPDDLMIDAADDLTVEQLRALAEMHLGMIGAA